ncbi:hypothetical protein PMIN02_008801 [Paraphaeosphaeria minitans]
MGVGEDRTAVLRQVSASAATSTLWSLRMCWISSRTSASGSVRIVWSRKCALSLAGALVVAVSRFVPALVRRLSLSAS